MYLHTSVQTCMKQSGHHETKLPPQAQKGSKGWKKSIRYSIPSTPTAKAMSFQWDNNQRQALMFWGGVGCKGPYCPQDSHPTAQIERHKAWQWSESNPRWDNESLQVHICKAPCSIDDELQCKESFIRFEPETKRNWWACVNFGAPICRFPRIAWTLKPSLHPIRNLSPYDYCIHDPNKAYKLPMPSYILTFAFSQSDPVFVQILPMFCVVDI